MLRWIATNVILYLAVVGPSFLVRKSVALIPRLVVAAWVVVAIRYLPWIVGMTQQIWSGSCDFACATSWAARSPWITVLVAPLSAVLFAARLRGGGLHPRPPGSGELGPIRSVRSRPCVRPDRLLDMRGPIPRPCYDRGRGSVCGCYDAIGDGEGIARPPNKELKLTKPSIMELRSLTLCWADLREQEERDGLCYGETAFLGSPVNIL